MGTLKPQSSWPYTAIHFHPRNADWRRPHHSSEVRPRSRHLHRRWSVYADACPENGVVLLCRSSSTASEPPICTYFHVLEAGSCCGAFPAGLYGNGVLVSIPACPPNASTPVGSERSGTADLQSETLRPHHRRTRQPSLAADPGAHTVWLQYWATEFFTIPRRDIWDHSSFRWHTWSTSTPLCQHRSPGSTLFQTFHNRQPSFSGCCLTDLELTTRHSRFGINTAVVPAPIENFFISTILYLLAL